MVWCMIRQGGGYAKTEKYSSTWGSAERCFHNLVAMQLGRPPAVSQPLYEAQKGTRRTRVYMDEVWEVVCVCMCVCVCVCVCGSPVVYTM
jgi:hypothetical protein